MAEGGKRSTRVRKPPNYLIDDAIRMKLEAQEHNSSSMLKLNYPKQYVSPAHELNINAKILCKFVNSVNKKFRQSNKTDVDQKMNIIEPEHQDLLNQVKKPNNNIDKLRKMEARNQELKNEKSRMDKKTQNNREKVGAKGSARTQKKSSEIMLSEQQKQLQKFGKEYSIFFNNQYTGMLNVLKSLDKKARVSSNQYQNKNETNGRQQRNNKSRQRVENGVRTRNQAEVSAENQGSRKVMQSDKLFKRSAYHVAIAYNIHLRRLEEKGADFNQISILDPTYHSRKVRGQYENPQGNKNKSA